MNQLGCYYLHTFYPSHLFLKNKKNFTFSFDNKKFAVFIAKNLKSLVINDFNNQIIIDPENNPLEADSNIPKKHKLEKSEISIDKGAMGINFENAPYSYFLNHSKHLYTEFYYKYYTEIIVIFESSQSPQNKDIALSALDFFINSYRMVSNDILTLTLDKMLYVSKVLRILSPLQ